MSPLILATLGAIVVLPVLFGFILKHINLPNKAKILVFTFINAFVGFIVIVPVPNFFIVPIPNIIALAALVLDSRLTINDIYGDFWKFNAASFVVTAIIFAGIAALVFRKKPLPNQQNQPI